MASLTPSTADVFNVSESTNDRALAWLVHIHCVSERWYGYRALAKQLGLPLVVTLHGELTMDADHVYESSKVFPGLLRRLLIEVDAVTACSQHTLNEGREFTRVELGAAWPGY